MISVGAPMKFSGTSPAIEHVINGATTTAVS